jgi:hypothetical protein
VPEENPYMEMPFEAKVPLFKDPYGKCRLVSIRLGRDDIKFAILASCGSRPPYRVRVMRSSKGLRGKFLIMWDKNDQIAGACDEALKKVGSPLQTKY